MSLGFIGGLAAAMDGYSKGADSWEKRVQAQAAEQRRADEHAYNQQVWQSELDAYGRKEQQRVDTEAAAKPLEVQTQEILPPEDDPFTPRQTTYKVGDQTFTDPSKAQTYATDPYAAYKRVADVGLRLGDVDTSLSIGQKMIQSRDLEKTWADKEKLRAVAGVNDAMTSRLFAPGTDLWSNGAGVLTELDKDGNTYKAEKQAGGTIVMNKYAPDGTLLGQHGSTIPDTYDGQRAFIGGFMNAPSWKEKDAQLGAWAKAQQDLRKEALKGAVDQATIAQKMAQATGTGGYANKGKGAKTDIEVLEERFKNFSPDSKNGRAEAIHIARQAHELNPNASQEEIVSAAQSAVVDGPDSPNIKQKLDFSTGKVTAVFSDPRTGKQVKLYQTEPKPEMAAAFKPEVQAFLNEQDAIGAKLGVRLSGDMGSNRKWSDAFKAAAANPSNGDAMKEVVQNTIYGLGSELQANAMRRLEAVNTQRRAAKLPELSAPTLKDVYDKAEQMVRSPQGMAAIHSRLGLVRQYGLN